MGNNAICSDLRMDNRDIVATYVDTESIGWMKILRTKPDILVTEDHIGIASFFFEFLYIIFLKINK